MAITQPNAGDTHLRNFKLVPETGRSILYFSGTSFLHAIEHSSIPGQKLPGTWHEPRNVIGRPVLVMNLRQIFMQVSWACVTGLARRW